MNTGIQVRDSGDPESRRFLTDDEILSDNQMHQEISDKVTIYDMITLKNIELEIAKGEFVAIVGQIRSGKSSVLSSIIGDMLYVNNEIIDEYKDNEIYKPTDNQDKNAKEHMLSLNNRNYKQFTELRQDQD